VLSFWDDNILSPYIEVPRVAICRACLREEGSPPQDRTAPGDAKRGASGEHLNLEDYKPFDDQTVPPPVQADLPDFVKRYMKKNGWEFEHSTIVVWHDRINSL
jgi:hypothetical protein